jgi:hypothetical protein
MARSIGGVGAAELKAAADAGKRIRLMATATRGADGGVACAVEPVAVERGH